MLTIQEKDMAMRMNGRKKGFTLIELLVVIAVIALLLSVLLPALNAVKRRAKYIVCAANQGQIVKSMRVYAMDNKDMLPGNWKNDGNSEGPIQEIPIWWMRTVVWKKMLPYWSDGLEIAFCPGNNDKDGFIIPDNVDKHFDPAFDGNAMVRTSYLYLPGLFDPVADPSSKNRWNDSNPKAAHLRFGRNRGDFLLVADLNRWSSEGWGNVNHPRRGSKFGSEETSQGSTTKDDIIQAIEGSNRGHVDGSVSRVGPDRMGTDEQSLLPTTSPGRQGRYQHGAGRPYFF